MPDPDDEEGPTLPEHLGTEDGLPDKERFQDVKKSALLQKAENNALKSNAPVLLK